MKRSKFIKIIFFVFLVTLFSVFLMNFWVEKNAEKRLYNTVNSIPKNKVGLVLGTAKYLTNGRINLYYKYRIDAAVELYKVNKVDYIVVSGDNGSKFYDEPSTFKEDLIKRGIPENKIYLDYAGFRTLDSVVRIKEVFGQNSVTIISQKFHNERAIFLADSYKLEAIGYNAKTITGKYALKVTVREYLARVKLLIDVVFNVQPKFLGKPINIP